MVIHGKKQAVRMAAALRPMVPKSKLQSGVVQEKTFPPAIVVRSEKADDGSQDQCRILFGSKRYCFIQSSPAAFNFTLTLTLPIAQEVKEMLNCRTKLVCVDQGLAYLIVRF